MYDRYTTSLSGVNDIRDVRFSIVQDLKTEMEMYDLREHNG